MSMDKGVGDGFFDGKPDSEDCCIFESCIDRQLKYLFDQLRNRSAIIEKLNRFRVWDAGVLVAHDEFLVGGLVELFHRVIECFMDAEKFVESGDDEDFVDLRVDVGEAELSAFLIGFVVDGDEGAQGR